MTWPPGLTARSGMLRGALGRDSSPHGVIAGPDGAAWITDSGQVVVVRVDPKIRAVKLFPAPKGKRYVKLDTAAFDARGVLWHEGQSGYCGKTIVIPILPGD